MKIHSSYIDTVIKWTGLVLFITSATLPTAQTAPVCYGKADIIFTIDASISIADPNFEKVCQLVVNLYTKMYDDLEEELRTGVILYASTVYGGDKMISLNGSQSQIVPLLTNFVRAFGYISTYTGAALREAHYMFTNHTRAGARKFLVLITDGRANDKDVVNTYAALIKNNDVHVVAVGIGLDNDLIDRTELNSVASSVNSVYISPEITDDLELAIQKDICGKTQDDKVPPTIERDTVKLDLYFFLDESMFVQDLEISKRFIKKILQSFEIGTGKTLASVFLYGTSTGENFVVGTYTTEAALFNGIDGLSLNSDNNGRRNVEIILNALQAQVSSTSTTGPVVAVLFLTGPADGAAAAIVKANTLRAATNPNIYLIVVGIGTNMDELSSQQNRLAYDIGTTFMAENFLNLVQTDAASVELVSSIRKTIYDLAKGTYVRIGTDMSYRWKTMFDVAFLIDGSSRMSLPLNENIVKYLIKQHIAEFELGPDAGRVAVLVFDSVGAYNIIRFDTYNHNHDTLNTLIDTLRLIRRVDTVDNAIGLAAALRYFGENNRESAAKVAILITLGQARNNLLADAQARALALEGIELIVIGIEPDISATELNSYMLFTPERPALTAPITTLAATRNQDVMKKNLFLAATTPRARGRYFWWDAKFDMIAVVLDESGRRDGGARVRYFLQDLFHRYQIGRNQVLGGVITFGAGVNTGAGKEIVLGSDSFYMALHYRIGQLVLTPTGGANVSAALDALITMFQNHGRANVSKVAMLLLQGDLDLAALSGKIQQVRDAGIAVTAVGIGQGTDIVDLRNIAYNSEAELAFLQPSWQTLHLTPQMDASIIALARGNFQAQGTGNLLKLTTQCNGNAGIYFILDASGSITEIFDDAKAFVAALMSGFTMPGVDIGALAFANIVLPNNITLGQYQNYAELYAHFMANINMDSRYMLTSTFDAIRKVVVAFNTSSKSYEKKIAVLLTDGKSIDTGETQQAAAEARAAGIKMLAIGVGESNIFQGELSFITGGEKTGGVDHKFVFMNTTADLKDPVKLASVQNLICTLIRPGECSAGSFRDPISMVCSLCPVGTYQPLSEQLICRMCGTGNTTSNPGATSITQCIQICNAGYYLDSSTGKCEICEIGWYQPKSNQTQCLRCNPATLITTYTGSTSKDDCILAECTTRMDLSFLVDSTASIGRMQFKMVKAFLINQLKRFTIASNETRISVVRIGVETTSEDITDFLTEENAIRDAIFNLTGGDLSTNIASAMVQAGKKFQEDGRSGIPKVMFFITDGMSENQYATRYQAFLMRQQGYEVVVIGVGKQYFMPEIQNLASHPENILTESDYFKLPALAAYTTICKAADRWTAPTVTPDPVVKCDLKLDLILLMDLSESLNFMERTWMKLRLESFIEELSISDTKVNVGVVSFGENVNTNDILQLSANSTTIENAIRSQPSAGYGTATDLGLTVSKLMLENSTRTDAAKAVLISTDGKSNNFGRTAAAARVVESSGIYVVAVGKGAEGGLLEKELDAISTSGSDTTIFVSTFKDLSNETLEKKVCPEHFTCSYSLQVIYIWYLSGNNTILDRTKILSADVSKRFSVQASIIEVKNGTKVDTLLKAVVEAEIQMNAIQVFDTIHNIVLISDELSAEVGNDASNLLNKTNSLKQEGVKITIVYARATQDTGWLQYATSNDTVFFGEDFHETIPAWKFHRSLCKEPCESGYEFGADGKCKQCAVGTYRDETESYLCKPCSKDSSTESTGSISADNCTILIKCGKPMDLLFVIDGTSSIGKYYDILKVFFWILVDKFPVGQDDTETRIGIVKIGDEVTENDFFLLSQSVNDIAVKVAIMKLPGDEQRTNTAASLEKVYDIFKTEGRDQKNFPHIVLIATDGRSESSLQTKRFSFILKLHGIRTLVIPLGSGVFQQEIDALAYDADSIFPFDNYASLAQSTFIHEKICDAARDFVSVQPDTGGADLIGECKSYMDIVFVIDASMSVDIVTFLKLRVFITQFARRLDIGLDKIRIGVIAFSSTVHETEVFPLDQSTDQTALSFFGVMNQKRNGNGTTNTAAALQRKINMFANKGRKNSPFVGIVMTDGRSDNPASTKLQAQIAKERGIHIVTVGFGNGVYLKELYDMATDPASVKVVDSFDQLTTEELLSLSCSYNFECPYKMDVIAIWDLTDSDTIRRAQIFIEGLKESFRNSKVRNVFVDHVEDVAQAVELGIQTQQDPARTDLNVARVVLTITDKSLDTSVKGRLRNVTTDAKNSGILMAVVDAAATPNGIADVASNEKLSFVTNKFDQLPFNLVLKRSFCTKPCESGEEVSADGSCKPCAVNKYRDADKTFLCTSCPTGRTTDGATGSDQFSDCLIGKCSSPMDIAFVVDSSSSVKPNEYSLMKIFLLETIRNMDIGADKTRAAIVPYTSDVLTPQLFTLQESTDQEAVLNAIRRLNQGNLPTGTNTAKAIEVAKEIHLTQGRITGDVTHNIVLLTDGMSTNSYRAVEEAEKAKNKFIRIYTIGVGQSTYTYELDRISSDEDSKMMVKNFLMLAAIKNFTEIICDDSFTCGKNVDLVIFKDNTIDDSVFNSKFDRFIAKMTNSTARLTNVSYTSMTELDSHVKSQNLSSDAQNTKVYIFIVKTDIADTTVQSSIVRELREKGGIIAIIKANDTVEKGNFVTIVSSLQFLFSVEKFDELPAYRFIERKLCIAPCPDGEQRELNGKCTKCPRGEYRQKTQSRVCVSCASGKTTRTTGSTQASDCLTNCGPGYKIVGDTCVECSKGEYQSDSFQFNCTSCAAGYTTPGTKSTSADQCIKNCEEGKKVSSTDKNTCVDCEENTYQPDKAQTECKSCPKNLVSGAGSVSLDNCTDVCGKPTDLIFLVDASLSLKQMEFSLIKVFLENSINRFKVGLSDTRIGVIQFSDQPAASPRLKLTQSVDRSTSIALSRALIHSRRPGTNTAAAIDDAVEMFDDQGRPGVHNVIVAVTDGKSDNTDLTKTAASKAKKKFIHIIAIGVGRSYFLSELKKIATDETAVKTFRSFYSLIAFNVLPIVCTPTQFTCDKNMDIFYIKHFEGNSTIETKVTTFLARLNNKYTGSTTYSLVDANSSTESLADDLNAFSDTTKPNYTKILIIFTNKANSGGASADVVKNKGVLVAVVYVSDAQTDTSYNTVVSDKDFLFYAENFDDSFYADFILRSLCVAPCVNGSERSTSGDCEECEKGSYRNAEDNHICVDCPSTPQETTTQGTGATDQSQCAVCASTEFPCTSGSTQCINASLVCDLTDHCSDGSDEICNDCTKGEKWNGVTCVDCEQGTFQDKTRQTECIRCRDGTTTNGTGKTSDTDCNVVCNENGKELDYPNGGCVNCSTGYFRDVDLHGICVKCDDDFTTKQEASTSKTDCIPPCERGTGYNDKTKECEGCSIGTHQPELNQYKCLDCPAGTTTQSVNSTNIANCTDPCDDGEELPRGSTSSADCTTCPIGTYKSSNETTCTSCPKGHITLGTGSNSSSKCLPNCSAGYYFDELLKKCVKCTFGTYQNEDNKKTCTMCDPGKTTRFQGSDSVNDCIVPCPAGSILPFRIDDTCTPCPQGTYRVNDETIANCTACENGKTTDTEGSTSAAQCKADCKSGEKIVGDSCVSCEVGTFQIDPRQTSCTPCANYTSTEQSGTTSADDCIDVCPSGTELTQQNPVVCDKCAMNYYKESGVDKKCTKCPNNTITLSDGAIKKTECVWDCESGQKYDTAAKQCVNCSIGTFQFGFHKDFCLQCRTGWTTLTTGSKLESDCKPNCTEGQQWDETTVSCVNCNKDEYQPDDKQLKCLKCPVGRFTDNTGATAQSQCKDQCQLGQEMKQGGMSPSDCVNCTEGTYRDGTTITCQQCPNNFTTSTDGKTASTDCEPPCPLGNYWNSSLTLCVNCEVGTYQNETKQYDCNSCSPAGFTTIQPQSTALTDCVSPCKIGSEFRNGACKPCEKGKYQNESNQISCKSCPAQKTTAGEGADNENKCIDPVCSSVDEWRCDNGQCIPETSRCNTNVDCTDGSDESTSNCCPVGQFFNYTGSRCDNCPAGKYQDETGKTACIDCPIGHVSAAGSDRRSNCTECPEGSELIVGNTVCTACPLHAYRGNGMMKCDNCPPNFITNQTGSDRLTDCKPNCTSGEYYDSGEFRCEPCPVGQYQHQVGQTDCNRCPTGTTTTVTGSNNSNQCTDICEPGKTLVYNTSGEPTTMCEDCPIQTSKDNNSNVCQPCPTGFTTSGMGSTECIPNCAPGFYYPNKTNSACEKCPKGKFQSKPLQPACDNCPLGKTTPIVGATTGLLCDDKCSDGYEYVPANDSCKICPKGTSREKDVDSECKSCSKPNYTTEGPGTATDEQCVPDCSPGQFYNRDTSRCESCPEDTFQTESHKFVCDNCPPGTKVAVTGSDEMSDCEDPCTVAGEQLQPNGSCGKCEIGTAKIPPSTICEICPPGFTTDGTGSIKCVRNCNEGSYSDGTKCSLCPKGKYQPLKNKDSCENCQPGLTTANRGSTNVSQCIEICPNGFELKVDGSCGKCEKNYYRTKGEQLQCTACRKDFTTPFEGAETSEDCDPPCDGGEEWSESEGKCVPCKKNFYQDQVKQKTCKPCKSGKITLNVGETSKEKCVGNCSPGTYWNESLGQCKDCEKGNYQSEFNKNLCVPCLPGFTTDFTKSTSLADCLDKCPSGYTYHAANDTCIECGYHKSRDRDIHNLCQDCPPGLITLTAHATSQAQCVSRCPAGKYWLTSKRICVDCDLGTFAPNSSALQCIQCDDGWVTLNTGSTQESDCKSPCLEGHKWNATNKRCVPCSIGEYQNLKNQINCIPCSTGKSTQTIGSTQESQCETTSCVAGEWRCFSGGGCVDDGKRCDSANDCGDSSDEAGCNCQLGQFYDYTATTPTCKDCLQGTYQDQTGQLSCINCPVGFTTAGNGTVSSTGCTPICSDGEKFDPADPSTNDCVQCPVGSYLKQGRDNPETCKTCPPPFTTQNPGASDISFCVPNCGLGKYYKELPDAGCKNCSLGYYQNQGYNKYSCTKCTPGTTTTTVGAESESSCTDVCNLGEELPIDGTESDDCEPCSAGYYKNGSTYLCPRCPNGLTSAVGSDSIDDCYKVCNAGEEFTSILGNTACKPCDKGYYKETPPTKTDQDCTPCPAGNSTQNVGATSLLLCQDLCNDGLELSADKSSCEECAVGEYRSQGSGRPNCESCPSGKTTRTAGSATIAACLVDCGIGQRYDNVSDTCIECEVGTYQDMPLMDNCQPCPGWKSTLGTGSTKYEDCIDSCDDGEQKVNNTCVVCERGSFRQKNVDPSCRFCRDKFTTLAPGQATVAACVPQCNRSQHWDENSDSCVPCEDGTHNPFEYQLQCLPCPPSRPISSDDFLSCQGDCAAGESWNAARQICNWCPMGTYSLGGKTNCTACPDGTYSYILGATFNECIQDCLPGFYRDVALSACVQCPTNQVSHSSRVTCETCTGNSVPSADRGRCVSPGSSLCPGGQEPDSNQASVCRDCRPGTFRPAGSTGRCQPCPVDYYQPASGQSQCTACTPPLKTQSTGTVLSANCKEDFCQGGYEPSGSSCVQCPPGKFKPDDTQGNCLTCPKDTYQNVPGSTSCVNCPVGDETEGTGSTSASDCQEDWCPGGQQPRDGNSAECEPCGLGRFKPSGVRGQCQLCDKLSYQDETGRTSCKPCQPDGFHTKFKGSKSASDCSAEWCPAGKTYIEKTKLCVDCGFGRYRSKLNIGCQDCPSGVTYSLTAESDDECEDPCPKGSFINFLTKSCDLCDENEYTDQANQNKCTPCGNGLRTPGKGAKSSEECRENWCPAGLTFDEGQEKCIPCGYGKYRQFKIDSVCIDCPDGQFTLTDVAASIDECVDRDVGTCMDGYVYEDGRCRPCPIGSYRMGTSTDCTECPPGFTTRRAGAYHENMCITMSSQCETRFDLIIAVDLSNSDYHDASQHIYRYLKPWLKCLIRRLDLHPYKVRVSILKYARGVSTLIDLADGYSSERICNLIDKGLKPSVWMNVNTGGALHKAYDLFRKQGRPGVQKHVLLITDDRSDNLARASQAARLLQDKQVHMTVIGPDVFEADLLASSIFSQFITPSYLSLPPDYDVVRAICRPRK